MKSPDLLSQINPAEQMVYFVLSAGFFYCRLKNNDGTQKITRQRWNAESEAWEDFPRDSLTPRVRKPISIMMYTRGMKKQEIADLLGVSVQTIVGDNMK